jgi:hypothetical protein
VTERCPYCDTPNDGETRDDCCSGAEAAALRVEVERLRAVVERMGDLVAAWQKVACA